MGPWPLAKLRRTHSRNRRYRSSRPRGLDRLATRWLDLGPGLRWLRDVSLPGFRREPSSYWYGHPWLRAKELPSFSHPHDGFRAIWDAPFDTWTSRLLAKLFQCTLWFQMNLAMKAHYKCAQMNHHVAANYKLPWCHYMGGNYHPQMVGLLSGFTH